MSEQGFCQQIKRELIYIFAVQSSMEQISKEITQNRQRELDVLNKGDQQRQRALDSMRQQFMQVSSDLMKGYAESLVGEKLQAFGDETVMQESLEQAQVKVRMRITEAAGTIVAMEDPDKIRYRREGAADEQIAAIEGQLQNHFLRRISSIWRNDTQKKNNRLALQESKRKVGHRFVSPVADQPEGQKRGNAFNFGIHETSIQDLSGQRQKKRQALYASPLALNPLAQIASDRTLLESYGKHPLDFQNKRRNDISQQNLQLLHKSQAVIEESNRQRQINKDSTMASAIHAVQQSQRKLQVTTLNQGSGLRIITDNQSPLVVSATTLSDYRTSRLDRNILQSNPSDQNFQLQFKTTDQRVGELRSKMRATNMDSRDSITQLSPMFLGNQKPLAMTNRQFEVDKITQILQSPTENRKDDTVRPRAVYTRKIINQNEERTRLTSELGETVTNMAFAKSLYTTQDSQAIDGSIDEVQRPFRRQTLPGIIAIPTNTDGKPEVKVIDENIISMHHSSELGEKTMLTRNNHPASSMMDNTIKTASQELDPLDQQYDKFTLVDRNQVRASQTIITSLSPSPSPSKDRSARQVYSIISQQNMIADEEIQAVNQQLNTENQTYTNQGVLEDHFDTFGIPEDRSEPGPIATRKTEHEHPVDDEEFEANFQKLLDRLNKHLESPERGRKVVQSVFENLEQAAAEDIREHYFNSKRHAQILSLDQKFDYDKPMFRSSHIGHQQVFKSNREQFAKILRNLDNDHVLNLRACKQANKLSEEMKRATFRQRMLDGIQDQYKVYEGQKKKKELNTRRLHSPSGSEEHLESNGENGTRENFVVMVGDTHHQTFTDTMSDAEKKLSFSERIELQIQKNQRNHKLIKYFLSEFKRLGDPTRIGVKMGQVSSEPPMITVPHILTQSDLLDQNGTGTTGFQAIFKPEAVSFFNKNGENVRGTFGMGQTGEPVFLQMQASANNTTLNVVREAQEQQVSETQSPSPDQMVLNGQNMYPNNPSPPIIEIAARIPVVEEQPHGRDLDELERNLRRVITGSQEVLKQRHGSTIHIKRDGTPSTKQNHFSHRDKSQQGIFTTEEESSGRPMEISVLSIMKPTISPKDAFNSVVKVQSRAQLIKNEQSQSLGEIKVIKKHFTGLKLPEGQQVEQGKIGIIDMKLFASSYISPSSPVSQAVLNRMGASRDLEEPELQTKRDLVSGKRSVKHLISLHNNAAEQSYITGRPTLMKNTEALPTRVSNSTIFRTAGHDAAVTMPTQKSIVAEEGRAGGDARTRNVTKGLTKNATQRTQKLVKDLMQIHSRPALDKYEIVETGETKEHDQTVSPQALRPVPSQVSPMFLQRQGTNGDVVLHMNTVKNGLPSSHPVRRQTKNQLAVYKELNTESFDIANIKFAQSLENSKSTGSARASPQQHERSVVFQSTTAIVEKVMQFESMDKKTHERPLLAEVSAIIHQSASKASLKTNSQIVTDYDQVSAALQKDRLGGSFDMYLNSDMMMPLTKRRNIDSTTRGVYLNAIKEKTLLENQLKAKIMRTQKREHKDKKNFESVAINNILTLEQLREGAGSQVAASKPRPAVMNTLQPRSMKKDLAHVLARSPSKMIALETEFGDSSLAARGRKAERGTKVLPKPQGAAGSERKELLVGDPSAAAIAVPNTLNHSNLVRTPLANDLGGSSHPGSARESSVYADQATPVLPSLPATYFASNDPRQSPSEFDLQNKTIRISKATQNQIKENVQKNFQTITVDTGSQSLSLGLGKKVMIQSAFKTPVAAPTDQSPTYNGRKHLPITNRNASKGGAGGAPFGPMAHGRQLVPLKKESQSRIAAVPSRNSIPIMIQNTNVQIQNVDQNQMNQMYRELYGHIEAAEQRQANDWSQVASTHQRQSTIESQTDPFGKKPTIGQNLGQFLQTNKDERAFNIKNAGKRESSAITPSGSFIHSQLANMESLGLKMQLEQANQRTPSPNIQQKQT